eukprot:SAG11_NODE_832_length_6948_cov_10.083662_6_plen_88_part_00
MGEMHSHKKNEPTIEWAGSTYFISVTAVEEDQLDIFDRHFAQPLGRLITSAMRVESGAQSSICSRFKIAVGHLRRPEHVLWRGLQFP